MNQNAGKPADQQAGTTTPADPVVITDPKTGQTIEDKEIQRQVIVKVKRNWKELALEFLLILAAVSLGFLADSLREKREDRQKEKKFIRSLVSDLKEDKATSQTVVDQVSYQIRQIDSLENLLLEGDLRKPSIVSKCYELTVAFTYYPLFFSEGTIIQLLSSGSMRLINNQEIASQIMSYHAAINYTAVIKQAYMSTIEDCNKSQHEIFNIWYRASKINSADSLVLYHNEGTDKQLMDYTDAQYRNFITMLERAKAQSINYVSQHQTMMAESDRLSEILRDEYNIKRVKESN